MNKQDYQELMDTFNNQLELTKQMIVIADSKFIAIKENNTDALMDITSKEENLARQIIQLEKKRDFHIKKIERQENIKIDNISKIIEKVSLEMSVNLNLVAQELKYNLEILQEKNNINQNVLSFIIEQIEIVNNMIMGDRVPNTYTNTKFTKNKYNSSNQTSYFDTKY